MMRLKREEGPDVKVEDVIDVARAAARVIMDVYDEKPEVWTNINAPDRSATQLFWEILDSKRSTTNIARVVRHEKLAEMHEQCSFW